MKITSSDYKKWITDLKKRFQQAQVKAAVKVNNTLLEFYWDLGKEIVEKQKTAPWGSGFLKQLSADLMHEFPEVKGFSEPNLRFIKRWLMFYAPNSVTSCDQIENIKEMVSQIPWGQNRVIVTKCVTKEEALFYVQQTIEHGWSRAVLTHQIESKLWERQGKAITNFDTQLPATDSDLAKQLIKDPYNFEFLTLTKGFKEKELEAGLVEHILPNFFLSWDLGLLILVVKLK